MFSYWIEPLLCYDRYNQEEYMCVYIIKKKYIVKICKNTQNYIYVYICIFYIYMYNKIQHIYNNIYI